MEQANKPLTMKTITVCLESSNEPYEKGSDFDISQYKEELYSFQWQGDSIAPVNSVEEAAKAAGNYGMLYSIMILKRRDRL